MIITKTPVRLSIIGGGTDFPIWFTKHGGLVLGGAINKHSLVSARYLPPFHDFKHRIIYREIEEVNDVDAINHKAVRACIKRVFETLRVGLEISHLSDLPGRSGTGSSSSFVVGLLHALSALKGHLMLPHELAQMAIAVEQKDLDETVGCQDQVFAAHGGFNVIRFKPDGKILVQPLPVDAARLRELESHLMLFFTKLPRTSSEIASTYVPTLAERETEQFGMMRLAEEGIHTVVKGNWRRLGELIDQSWRIKAGLSPSVTNQVLNDLYLKARVAGAWGGKLTGAGGGGCMILVVPPEKQLKVAAALADVTVHIPFRFAAEGSSVVYVDRDNLNEYRA